MEEHNPVALDGPVLNLLAVQRGLLRWPTLTDTEKVILTALLLRTGQSGAAETTQTQLAADTGYHERTINRLLSALRREGWFSVENRAPFPALFRWRQDGPLADLADAWLARGPLRSVKRQDQPAPFMSSAKKRSDSADVSLETRTPLLEEAAVESSGGLPSDEMAAILVAQAEQRKLHRLGRDQSEIPEEAIDGATLLPCCPRALVEVWLRDLSASIGLDMRAAAREALAEWWKMPGTARVCDRGVGVLDKTGHPLRLFWGKDLDVVRTTLERRHASRYGAVAGEPTPLGVRRQMLAAQIDLQLGRVWADEALQKQKAAAGFDAAVAAADARVA